MKRIFNRIAVFTLTSTLFITGCSSIPLSTMMKLSSMGVEGIFEANPSEVRVKFSMPKDFTLDVENTSLSLRVTGEDDISAPFAETPPDATEVSFWVDLQLTPDEPYLRLFDGVKVTFEET